MIMKYLINFIRHLLFCFLALFVVVLVVWILAFPYLINDYFPGYIPSFLLKTFPDTALSIFWFFILFIYASYWSLNNEYKKRNKI
ncbi:hypothetical protein ASD98_16810 [Flavobacterium sp. Root186]|nr:hypothetical protein ASD98_16810 [Flavobacterium sp. Root186]